MLQTICLISSGNSIWLSLLCLIQGFHESALPPCRVLWMQDTFARRFVKRAASLARRFFGRLDFALFHQSSRPLNIGSSRCTKNPVALSLAR